MSRHKQGDRIIVERRRLEDLRQSRMNDCVSDFKHRSVTEWNNKTERVIQQNQINRTFQQIKQKQADDLERRKSKLRELFAKDSQIFADEMLSLQEPPELRRQKLKERALALKREREQREQAFALEAQRQLFRSSNADFRKQQKMQEDMQVKRDLELQMQERAIMQRFQKEEDAKYDKLWQQNLKDKEDFVRGDNIARNQDIQKTKTILEDQIAERSYNQFLASLEREEDAERLQAELKKSQEEEEAKKREATEKMKSQRLEFESFRDKRAEELRKAREEQQKEDMKIAEMYKKQAQEQARANVTNKAALREEQLAHLEYIRRLKHEEYLRGLELDKYRREQDKQNWFNLTEKGASEDAARKKLLEDVIAEQQQQRDLRKLEKEKEKQQVLIEREKLALEHAKIKEEEEAQKRTAYEQKLRQRAVLQRQIEQRENAYRAEFAESHLDAEKAAISERHYQEFLQDELARSAKGRGQHKYGKKNMNTFC